MRTDAGAVYVLLRNHQNSTSVVYDPVQTTVKHQRYLPFGGRRGSTPIEETERGFLDRVEDESGLIAMGARHYDPKVGRFLSVDPLADLAQPQSLATYSYSQNNPTSYTDPSGLMREHPLDWDLGSGDNPSESTRQETQSTTAAADKTARETVVKIVEAIAHLDALQETAPGLYYDQKASTCQANGNLLASFGGCEAFFRADFIGRALLPELSTTDEIFNVLNGIIMMVLIVETAGLAAEALPLLTARAPNAAATAAQLGRQGEALVPGTGSTVRIAASNGSYRIPDILDRSRGIIGEVKNVGRLSYTDQLRDFANYAQSNGFRFQLYVRENTVVSGPLQAAVNAGDVNLIRMLPAR